ncbi:MAG: hypothetical protein JW987_09130 [Anaerolineaceae bacterium]|nr:hypothetical protein [Anaerolineaceae bacterium]
MNTPKHFPWLRILEALFFSFVFLLILPRILDSGLSHDEYQFVAPAQFLAGQGLLPYLDFPYHHTPYQLAVNALAVALTRYDFLAVRATASLFTFFSALLLYQSVKKSFHNRPALFQFLAGALSVLAFLLDPSLAFLDGRAFNHTLTCFFSLLAWRAFQSGLDQAPRFRTFGLAGLFAALAAGVRLSYAVVIIVLGGVLLLNLIRGDRRRLRPLLLLAAGFALGMLPALILFLFAPQQFIYGNVIYINLNRLYREYLGHRGKMDLFSKLSYFYWEVLKHPATMLLYVAALWFSTQTAIQFIRSRSRDLPAWTLCALILALFASAFAPTPLWVQYFFAPLPFLVIASAAALSQLKPFRWQALGLAALAALILFQGNLFTDLTRVKILARPAEWIPLQVHQYAQTLSKHVPSGKILTLVPMLPLEGGLDSYEMFAVGPFSWRTVNFLTVERRQKYEVIAPVDLEAFLAADPPAAILTGFEVQHEGLTPETPGNLEAPLEDYARSHGYSPIQIFAPFYNIETTLWVK